MVELNKIYNEDCLQTMARMGSGSVDVVFTSPPYNKSRQSTGTHKEVDYNKHYIGFDDNMPMEKYIDWLLSVMKELSRVVKEHGVILWNMSYGSETIEQANQMYLFLSRVLQETDLCVADTIVWHKKSAVPNNVSPNKLTRICEFVYVFVHKDHFDDYETGKKFTSTRPSGQNNHENLFNFIQAPNNNEVCEFHKAAFSIELVGKLLNMYKRGHGVVYDPFMGTGTTAIACIRLEHDYIGSEIVKEYHDWAENRIKNETRQLKLF